MGENWFELQNGAKIILNTYQIPVGDDVWLQQLGGVIMEAVGTGGQSVQLHDALLSAAANSLAVGLKRWPPLPRITENRFCKKMFCQCKSIIYQEQVVIEI